jgi:hypothetical protein
VGYEFLESGVTTVAEDPEDGSVDQELRACDTTTGAGALDIDLDDGGCSAC